MKAVITFTDGTEKQIPIKFHGDLQLAGTYHGGEAVFRITVKYFDDENQYSYFPASNVRSAEVKE